VTNNKIFVADLSEFVAPGEAVRLVEKLHGGHAIRIPGEYRLDEIEGKFGVPRKAGNLSKVAFRSLQSIVTIPLVCPRCDDVLPVPDLLVNEPRYLPVVRRTLKG
jgi:hypothetical protein